MKTILFVIISIVLSIVTVIDFTKMMNDTKHPWLRIADCAIDALVLVGFAWIAKGAF